MFELMPGALDLELSGGELVDLGPHELLPSVKASSASEESVDLAEAESRSLPHANHEHSVHGVRPVPPLPRNPWRRWKQTSAFIETQGRRPCRRLGFELSDAQSSNHLT